MFGCPQSLVPPGGNRRDATKTYLDIQLAMRLGAALSTGLAAPLLAIDRPIPRQVAVATYRYAVNRFLTRVGWKFGSLLELPQARALEHVVSPVDLDTAASALLRR
jgi:hypothetical protein